MCPSDTSCSRLCAISTEMSSLMYKGFPLVRLHTYCDTSSSVAVPASASTSVAAASDPRPSRWIDRADSERTSRSNVFRLTGRPLPKYVQFAITWIGRRPSCVLRTDSALPDGGSARCRSSRMSSSGRILDSSHNAATTPSMRANPVAAARTPELMLSRLAHSGTSASTTPGATRRTALRPGSPSSSPSLAQELNPGPHQWQPDTGWMRGPRHRHPGCWAPAETACASAVFPIPLSPVSRIKPPDPAWAPFSAAVMVSSSDARPTNGSRPCRSGPAETGASTGGLKCRSADLSQILR